tara:strand:+ start:4592 stop:6385 length:1794 start_codon:yes stop_codon:yes gene_type:complete
MNSNMKLSREETQAIINTGKAQGLNGQDVFNSLIKKGYEPEGYTPAPKQNLMTETKSIVDTAKEAGGDILGIGKDIIKSSTKRADNIQETKDAYNSGEQGFMQSQYQKTGQLAGSAADAIGATFKGVANLALSDKTEKKITAGLGNLAGEVMKNPGVQNVVKWYDGLTPEQQRNLDAVGGVVSLVSEFVGVGGASKATTPIKRGVTELTNNADDLLQQGGKAFGETLESGVDAIKSNVDNVVKGTTDTPVFSSIDDAIKDTASGRTLDNTSKIRQGAGGQEGLLTTAEKKKLLEISPEKGNKYIEALKQSEADLDAPTIFSVLEDDALNAVTAYKNATSKIGSDIGDIKKALQSKKVTIKDTNEIIKDITTKLAEKRVIFKNGKFNLGKQSPFTQADVNALNDQILDTLNNVKSARSMDDLLLGMERLDNIINFNKTSDLTGSLQGVSKNVRAKLKNIRDKALTPEQAKRFEDFSQAQTFADEFLKSDNKISTLLNRLGSKNSRKSVEFVDEIKRVTGENIGDSAKLVEILTSATGTTSRNRSLLQRYMGDVASDVASLSPTGILGSTVNAGVKSLLKVDKLNEIQKAINTIINLPK